MRSKKTYRYFGLEYIDMPADQRPAFCRFAVYLENVCVFETYTNRYLKGSYMYDEAMCSFRQRASPNDFSLDGYKRDSVMKLLKRIIDKQHQ